MIEPFFLGDDGRKVFAVYHAAADPASDVLAVISPPLFSEGLRTQLALRELAIALAEENQHVIRFDWLGTGDSSGVLADMRVSDWAADVGAIIDEGRDITGAARINLVGVRAGALLLCNALRSLAPVERVVLWDPVRRGNDYLEELRRIQERMLERNRYLTTASRRVAEQELGGQRIPADLRNDIEALDDRVYTGVPAQRLTVIVTDGSNAFEGEAEPLVIRFSCNWQTDSEDLMLPQPVLERIRTCLLEG
jgi:pimeloyl-ACP methyl ester carboxylesterase